MTGKYGFYNEGIQLLATDIHDDLVANVDAKRQAGEGD
jgi:hypothetical protein